MKRILLATTALVALSSAAFAAETRPAANGTGTPAPMATPAQPGMQGSSEPMKLMLPQTAAGEFLATKVLGQTIYTSDAKDAESIGKIDDLTITADGSVSQAIVGVGGFLGLGTKEVAVPLDQIHWSTKDGNLYAVLSTSKEQLEAAPAIDLKKYDPMATTNGQAMAPATAPSDSTQEDHAMAPAAPAAPGDQAVAPNASGPLPGVASNDQPKSQDRVAVPPADTLQSLASDSVTTDQLEDVAVYSADQQNVGEVSDVIVSEDGKINALVVDVGGFLGIGQKPVAIDFDAVKIRKDQNNGLYVFTDLTKDQLNAAPEFKKST